MMLHLKEKVKSLFFIPVKQLEFIIKYKKIENLL